MLGTGRPGSTGHNLGSGADNPAVGDQAVPAGRNRTRDRRHPQLGGARQCCDSRLHWPTGTRSPPPRSSRSGSARPRSSLGDRLLILGHHYQRPEVIRWADLRGDSFKLAQWAAEHDEADTIVFCGVHFMAESADILTDDHQRVILPDLNAGCSMADMADIDQVEEAWEEIAGIDRHRADRADHLHELVGRAEGVRRRARRRGLHVVERARRPRVGVRQG